MRRAIAIFVLMSFPASAAAQTNLPRASEVTTPALEYDFEADEVEGRLIKPNEPNILPQTYDGPSELIRIRADFVSEILTSVEHI